MNIREPLTTRKINVALLAIFAISLALKSAIVIFATDPIIFTKYPYFAERLAGGGDIGERILDLSPLYLYIVKTFFHLFGPDWDLLMVLQIVSGSINCVMVGLIGAKIFSPAVGILSAVILLFYGNMTLIELTLEPEAVLLLLNSLAVLSLLWARGEENMPPPKAARWLSAGILIGLAAITKANAILLIPGAAIWLWLSLKKGRYQALAFLLAGCILVIAPVAIRNAVRFHDFVLLTADGGKVFFHGNGPGATGMERADLPDQGFIEEGHQEPDYAHVLFRKEARRETKANLKPSECSSYWFSRTTKYMIANPGVAIHNFLKKSILFFNNYEVHDLDTTYKSYKILQSWPLLTAGIIAALGMAGMVFSFGLFRRAFLPYWMVFTYLFSVILFFSASRYRLPAFSLLAIFAASFLCKLFSRLRNKRFKEAAVMLLLLSVFLALTYLPFNGEIDKFDRWQQTARLDYSLGGRLLFKNGKYQEAAREFEKVVSAAPAFTPAVNYLGKTYAIMGNYDKAAECFQKVIRLSPNTGEGYLNAGLLFELRGDRKEARRYFEMAAALTPENVKARNYLDRVRTD